MTDRIHLDHLTHDQYDQLCHRLEHAEAELTRYTEGDSADAAAGSYAGRAEEAEAALARVRGLADEWDMHAPPPGNRPLIELRAALDGPGRADSTPAELTAEEARAHADELATDLYRAQDALAFVGECCDIADRERRQPTTADVREWLKGARCGRQLAAEAPAGAGPVCGAEPPSDGQWGDCWCTLPPGHPGEHRCQPCTDRHGAPGWTADGPDDLTGVWTPDPPIGCLTPTAGAEPVPATPEPSDPTQCTGDEGFCPEHGYHRHSLKQPGTSSPPEEVAAEFKSPDVLREQIAAAMREHHLVTNRAEADADGNAPCRCGDWHEPGPMGSDEDDWDSHMAEVALAVILPNTRIIATLARDSEATVQRVIALYERWVKAGPPPLGTPVSRWWDRRLAELHTALKPPKGN